MRPAAQRHPGRCIRRGPLLPATGAGCRCSRAEDQGDRGQHARASPLTRCNSQPRAIPWGTTREEGSSACNKARRCLGEAEGKRALFLGCPSFAGSCSLIAPQPPIFLPQFPASDPSRPRRPGKDAELLHPVWWAWPGAGSAGGFLARGLSFWPRTSHEAPARPLRSAACIWGSGESSCSDAGWLLASFASRLGISCLSLSLFERGASQLSRSLPRRRGHLPLLGVYSNC